jgi:hypothetical protein
MVRDLKTMILVPDAEVRAAFQDMRQLLFR